MIAVALLLLANPPTSPNTQQVPSNSAPRVNCQQADQKPASGNGLGEYPSSYGAATELQNQVERATQCLSQPDIRSAFGADSQWEEVDRRSGQQNSGKPGKKAPKSSQSVNAAVPKP